MSVMILHCLLLSLLLTGLALAIAAVRLGSAARRRPTGGVATGTPQATPARGVFSQTTPGLRLLNAAAGLAGSSRWIAHAPRGGTPIV